MQLTQLQGFMEDIVRGYTTEFDCIIKLREKIRNLAREFGELSDNLPTGMDRSDTGGLKHED